MIPKTVHQIAPRDHARWSPVWVSCQASWEAQFPAPEYQYRFWNDDELDILVRQSYPEYLDLFERYPLHIYRIDLAKYLILHREGGIYADMDVFCWRNFYANIRQPTAIVEGTASNSMMASSAGNPLWLALLARAEAYADQHADRLHDLRSEDYPYGRIVLEATGPLLLNALAANANVQTLPAQSYGVYPPSLSQQDRRSRIIFTEHHLTGQWDCRPTPDPPPREPGEDLPAFTPDGFEKRPIPEALFQTLATFYTEHRDDGRDEVVQGGWLVNPTLLPSRLIELPQAIKDDVHAVLSGICEDWTVLSLTPTYVYGIRKYLRGTVLRMHRDVFGTHMIGASLNIAQACDTPWPLTIEDHTRHRHQVLLASGEMLLYESARLLHGRPVPLDGEFYSGVFVHFKLAA